MPSHIHSHIPLQHHTTYRHIILCYPTRIHISGTYTLTQVYVSPYMCTQTSTPTPPCCPSHVHSQHPIIPLYSHYYTLPNHSTREHSHILVHYPMHSYPLSRLPHLHTSILSPSTTPTCTRALICPLTIILARTYSHHLTCVLTLCHTCSLSHVSISMSLVITFMIAMPWLFPQDTSVHPSFGHGPPDG